MIALAGSSQLTTGFERPKEGFSGYALSVCAKRVGCSEGDGLTSSFDLPRNASPSIIDAVSIERANFANFFSLISSFSPTGKTNLPSGRLMPQIAQSKSLFLLSAVIGIGNLVTSPLDDVVL